LADKRQDDYHVEADKDLTVQGADVARFENPNPLFRAGQSNRVWGELYKVGKMSIFDFYIISQFIILVICHSRKTF
jgi:hypothetical protein